MPIKNINNKQEVNLENLENFKKFLENKKNINQIEEVKQNNPVEDEFYDQNFDFSENNDILPEDQNYDDDNLTKNFDEEEYASEVRLNKNANLNFTKEKPSINDLFANNRQKNQKSRYNPLLDYRDPGISIRLPSLGNYYSENEIELEPNGEVNVYPMTIKDEIYLRSPEYLLNGSAIEKIIESCVPSVKNVRKLLTNDVMALIMAIRWASGSDIISYSSSCPKCNAKNNFDIKMDYLFEQMTYLKESYHVDINNNIIVFVKPFNYETVVKNAIISFEETKLLQILSTDTETSENEKIKKAKESLERVQEMVLQSVLNSIVKVLIKDKNLTIDDTIMIEEWLRKIKLKDFNKIKDFIAKINDIGLPNSVNVKCRSCNYNYDIEIKYDPSDFLD